MTTKDKLIALFKSKIKYVCQFTDVFEIYWDSNLRDVLRVNRDRISFKGISEKLSWDEYCYLKDLAEEAIEEREEQRAIKQKEESLKLIDKLYAEL